MNRLKILILILMTTTAALFGQNAKVVSAWNGIQYYQRDDDKDALIKAKENIDIASKHETTSQKGKTWYYRGLIYQMIFEDPDYTIQYPDALDEAFASYKKAIDLNDSKFKDKDRVFKNVYALSIHYHNSGVDYYKSAQYEKAYHNFSSILAIKDFLDKYDKEVQIDVQTATLNAALSAEKMGNRQEAKAMYKKLIEMEFDNPAIYQSLAAIYKDEDNTEETMKVLALGLERYPTNIGLIIDELNIYLAQNRHAEVIDKLKKAIEVEPGNVQLYYALGSAYDNVAAQAKEQMDALKEERSDPEEIAQLNEELKANIENAVATYKKAIEVDPTFFDIYNNLGAVYYNQAVELNKQMNEITGFSSAEQKKYEALEKERNGLYETALPFFEKAYELQPDAIEILNALKEIYAKMGNYEKSGEMKDKINQLKGG